MAHVQPLTGRVAIVTGGTRGIGLAIARGFAREGAKVAICGRSKASLHEAAADLRALGADVIAAAADVAVPSQAAEFARHVEHGFGAVDLLVNNAGNVTRKRLDEVTDEEWASVLGSNLTGTFLLTRAVLPGMRARRRGRIINIASIAGRQGTALLGPYCAAKHGVVGLTRSLALEVKADGIQVNAICPGSVDTPMLQVGMPGAKADMSPDDIAQAALYLAIEAPDVMTGQCLDIYGAG